MRMIGSGGASRSGSSAAHRQLAALPTLDSRLRDPKSDNIDQTPAYAKNESRAIKPEIAVIVGICTHLGCSPGYVPEMLPQPFDAQWKGGFYCPCHQSRFDLAGRVFDGVPAPTNLEIPPYHFVDDGRLQIGVAPQGAAVISSQALNGGIGLVKERNPGMSLPTQASRYTRRRTSTSVYFGSLASWSGQPDRRRHLS